MAGLLLEESRPEPAAGDWVELVRELRQEVAQLRGAVASLRRENRL